MEQVEFARANRQRERSTHVPAAYFRPVSMGPAPNPGGLHGICLFLTDFPEDGQGLRGSPRMDRYAYSYSSAGYSGVIAGNFELMIN